jgi:type II restriction enzyme
MLSPFCERAIENAIHYGNALLKFISPNDVGLTGGHQCGFYLPKTAYQMFTPHPPIKGENSKHQVTIEWQDEIVTESVVTWYGKAKDEYRLTRFGKGFPFLAADTVGDLLVLIPKTETEFLAYVLDLDEDIEEIQAALGVEVLESWGVYHNGVPQFESENDCVERRFRLFAQGLADFPKGEVFTAEARQALLACIVNFKSMTADEMLMKSMDAEYQLFRLVERQVCQSEIVRVFRDVDDFLQTASSIMNRRKSRAGRSLENHVKQLLTDANIPHKMQPKIDGKPDVVIPSEDAYRDSSYPLEKLFIIGIKTTCKDRWRQVLNEGKRQPDKHILTLQPGISGNQLEEMRSANVTLIVPRQLHKDFPKERRITLLNLEEFFSTVRTQLGT